MEKTESKLLPQIGEFIEKLDYENIASDRKDVLQLMIDYIQSKRDKNEVVNLNFICTHNSRRSQFSQIWAKTAAHYFSIDINSFSGGVEVTAFNERAVASIKRSGFEVSGEQADNPRYQIVYAEDATPLTAFSKLFDDPENATSGFAAVMTCSHADENCPFIPGAEARLPVRYEDPKAFDDSPLEAQKYDERSVQIATEMFYAFSRVR